MYSGIYLSNSHKHCFANRVAIEKSTTCGCFQCGTIFAASLVTNWMKEQNGNNDTGWCPHCEIDSVIGDYSHDIDESFLSAMNKRFFNSDSSSEYVVFESFEDLFNSYHSLG